MIVEHTVAIKVKTCLVVTGEDDMHQQIADMKEAFENSVKFEAKPEMKKDKAVLHQLSKDWDK